MAHKPRADEGSTRDRTPATASAADADVLRQEIQLRAYYRYCERGSTPGADVDDWLAAEREVLGVQTEPDASEAKMAGG